MNLDGGKECRGAAVSLCGAGKQGTGRRKGCRTGEGRDTTKGTWYKMMKETQIGQEHNNVKGERREEEIWLMQRNRKERECKG